MPGLLFERKLAKVQLCTMETPGMACDSTPSFRGRGEHPVRSYHFQRFPEARKCNTWDVTLMLWPHSEAEREVASPTGSISILPS